MVSTRRQSQQKRADEAASLQANMSMLSRKSGSIEASAGSVPASTPALPSITRRAPRHKVLSKLTGIKRYTQSQRETASTPYQDSASLGSLETGHSTEAAKVASGLGKFHPLPPAPTKVDINHGYNSSSCKMMDESRTDVAQIRARMAALPPVPTDIEFPGRKIANAKGKVGRFSDVHMAEFRKMDSIANHPSVRRADTNRLKSSSYATLKRSSSKAELDKPTYLDSLKHSPSKTKLEKPSHLKQSPSNAGQTTPANSSLQVSTIVGIPSLLKSPTCSPKRVKRDVTDDATTLRPKSRDGEVQRRIPTSLIAPRVVHSNLLTPTKASLARSNSTKDLRATMIPSISRPKSTMDLLEVRVVGQGMTPVKALLRPPQQSISVNLNSPTRPLPHTPTRSLLKPPKKIKSILRTPRRLYSDDPSEIAAGTHFATPPDANKPMRQPPATAPVTKHVDFSASARLKAAHDEMKAASTEPEVPLYPVLPELDPNRFNRRMTLSSLPMPGSFTFRSGASMTFDRIPANSTIRAVRTSDAETSMNVSSIFSSLKRKAEDAALDVIDEDNEGKKENSETGADKRQAKRIRLEPKAPAAVVSPRKRLVKDRLHTLAGGTKRVANGLTSSRLHFLATPKKRT